MLRRATVGVLLAGLAVTGCGGDKPGATPATSPPTTATPTQPATPAASSSCPAQVPLPAGATLITATVAGGKVTSAQHTWSVKRGTQVRIAVTADVKDEVHVHGYDRKAETTPGCPTAIDFAAGIPGSVEVELEDAGLHLFDLKAT